MQIFSTIVRYIFIVILTIAIIGLTFIGIASSTVLDKQYVLAKLEETNYYNGIYEEMKSNFDRYVQQSGLDENILSEVVTEEKVKNDSQIMINNIYDGADETIDTQEIKDNLNKKIEESVANPRLLQMQRESIDSFVGKICDEYENTLVHTDYEQNINNKYFKVLKLAQIGKKAVLIAILVLVVLILALAYKRIFRGVASIGVSLVSSGALLVILNIFVNNKIKINTITVFNQTISNSLRTILNDIMAQITNFGYIILAAGVLTIILGNVIDSVIYKKTEGD